MAHEKEAGGIRLWGGDSLAILNAQPSQPPSQPGVWTNERETQRFRPSWRAGPSQTKEHHELAPVAWFTRVLQRLPERPPAPRRNAEPPGAAAMTSCRQHRLE